MAGFTDNQHLKIDKFCFSNHCETLSGNVIGLTPSNQPSTTTTTDKKSNIDDIKPMSEDDAKKRRQTILNEMFLTNFFF